MKKSAKVFVPNRVTGERRGFDLAAFTALALTTAICSDEYTQTYEAGVWRSIR
jgi:hypothetical protein